jgi:hypothetical protein
MRRARGQRRSRWTAAAALLAAAATLIGQGWATSHDVAIRHVLCAEHGEVTHVAPARADAAAPPSASARLARPSAAVPAGRRAPCEHEHCAVASALRDGADPPPARAAVCFVPPPPTASAPRTDVVPARGRSRVLASAPKTSPPAARA